MADPVVSREQIAALACEAAKAWSSSGYVATPQNPFPALSAAAKQFDIDLHRFVTGAEPGEGEASA